MNSLLQLYTVFDNKVGAFAAPFVCRAKGEAIRSFQQACSDDNLPFKKAPGDYVLYYVGGWDDQNGRLMPIEMPERVVSGDEF